MFKHLSILVSTFCLLSNLHKIHIITPNAKCLIKGAYLSDNDKAQMRQIRDTAIKQTKLRTFNRISKRHE